MGRAPFQLIITICSRKEGVRDEEGSSDRHSNTDVALMVSLFTKIYLRLYPHDVINIVAVSVFRNQ